MRLSEDIPRVVRKRTVRGAHRLDKARPGWHNRINLDTLDISDYHHCIAGQLAGSFSGYYDLGLRGSPEQNGMLARDGSKDNSLLTRAWVDEIVVRQNEDVRRRCSAPQRRSKLMHALRFLCLMLPI